MLQSCTHNRPFSDVHLAPSNSMLCQPAGAFADRFGRCSQHPCRTAAVLQARSPTAASLWCYCCRIWTPKYWTNISFVQFNFTGFVDYESSIMRYQWGLGTAPFANDVMPLTQVTGNKFVKDIRFSGSSKHMFVTVVVSCSALCQLADVYYVPLVGLIICNMLCFGITL